MTNLDIFLRDVRRIPRLTPEEESGLLERYRDGDRTAIELLVLAHLPLVVRIAKGYRGRGLDFQDLIQEGAMGLLEATESFDPNRAGDLGRYAAKAIRGAIRDALAEHAGPFRLPLVTAYQARRALPADSGRSEATLLAAQRAYAMKPMEVQEDHRTTAEGAPEALQRAETVASVREALEGLEDSESFLARLRHFDELTVPEIAQQVGLSPRSVTRHLKSLLDVLSVRLSSLSEVHV